MDIREALSTLDHDDESLWTAQGAPKVDAVRLLVEDKIFVDRQSILDAAPDFEKGKPISDEPDEPDESPPEAPVSEDLLDPEVDNRILEDYLERPVFEKTIDFANYVMKIPAGTLESFRVIVEAQINAAVQAEADAAILRRRLKSYVSLVQNRINNLKPDDTNQQAIQRFIKSQNELRGIKVAVTKKILAGVDLKTLDPRAQIDKALSRKRGRGTARPLYPRVR